MLWMIFFFYFSFSSSLTIYENAKFEPNSIYLTLDNITQIYSQIDCVCLCYANVKCLTATYFGVERRCVLFMTTLDQGTVSLMTTNEMTSVLTFKNKTLPGKCLLIGKNK